MRKIIASLILAAAIVPGSLLGAPATVTYILDASQSKFMAHANAGGLLWFKGKDHHLAAREFSGQVEIIDIVNAQEAIHWLAFRIDERKHDGGKSRARRV